MKTARFAALGVITGKEDVSLKRIEDFIGRMKQLFARPDCDKEDLVGVIVDYLPNFAHIETSRSLDQKM